VLWPAFDNYGLARIFEIILTSRLLKNSASNRFWEGHGLSRAAKSSKIGRALAPEVGFLLPKRVFQQPPRQPEFLPGVLRRQEVCMRKYGLSVFSLAIFAIALTLACGSSAPAYMLQSVNLSPPTADAQGSPVQLTATGYFNQQPSPVKMLTAHWGACYQNQATTAVTVSADGLAQCAAGAVGTYTVWAWAERGGDSCGPAGSVPANPCGGSGECQVTGTARLTCP
jgi:hypothetical protein